MSSRTPRTTLFSMGAAVVWVLLIAPPSAMPQISGGGRGGGIRLGDPVDESKKAEAIRKKAQSYYEDGLKRLEKGQIQAAKTRFKSVIELVGLEGVGQAAFDRLMQLHREGMERLERAADYYEEGRYLEAIDLARETKVLYANLFGGVPTAERVPNVSQEAARLIAQIEADPQAREAIQEPAAARLYRKVEKLDREIRRSPEKHVELHDTLAKIAKRYPDCGTGRLANRRLEELEQDRRLMRLIQAERDRRWIADALRRFDELSSAGKLEAAEAERERLTKRFPGRTIEELRQMAKTRPRWPR